MPGITLLKRLIRITVTRTRTFRSTRLCQLFSASSSVISDCSSCVNVHGKMSCRMLLPWFLSSAFRRCNKPAATPMVNTGNLVNCSYCFDQRRLVCNITSRVDAGRQDPPFCHLRQRWWREGRAGTGYGRVGSPGRKGGWMKGSEDCIPMFGLMACIFNNLRSRNGKTM